MALIFRFHLLRKLFAILNTCKAQNNLCVYIQNLPSLLLQFISDQGTIYCNDDMWW
jgi:hypothetical protein